MRVFLLNLGRIQAARLCTSLALFDRLLAAEEIPVILTSTMDTPGRAHEGYGGAYLDSSRRRSAARQALAYFSV
ncbi:MAG: hypothetical protein IIB90_07150 [Gemmatimonadetes bacterium]|nr:hypothetical protein [Gemmatimonadota bacterium]